MKEVLNVTVFTLVHSWAQDVDLTYELEKSKFSPDLIDVILYLSNESENDIYFLTESCNGLDYYLTTNSELVEVYILINCNGSSPIKVELKAGAIYEYKTTLKVNGNVEKIGLDLELIQLLKTPKIEGKLIGEVQDEHVQHTSKIIGPIVSVE